MFSPLMEDCFQITALVKLIVLSFYVALGYFQGTKLYGLRAKACPRNLVAGKHLASASSCLYYRSLRLPLSIIKTMSPSQGLRKFPLSHLLTLGPSTQCNIRLFSAACRYNSPHPSSSPRTTTTAPPRHKQYSTVVTKAKPHTIDPRWLTDTKRRIGKCLMFGLKPAQVDEAGRILQRLARDWRELIAGSDGFLTHATRRALFRRDVVWGDMVIFLV